MFTVPAPKQGGSLVAIKNVVATSSSPYAKLFAELLESGNIVSVTTKNRTALDLFGPTEDYHVRVGKLFSPFPRAAQDFPQPDDLRDALQEELKLLSGNEAIKSLWLWTDTPTDGKRKAEAQEVNALISHIADPSYRAPGFIPSMKSTILAERFAPSVGKVDPRDQILVSNTGLAFSLLPDQTEIELQHANESMAFSTVLSGCMVYIVWPPTQNNLELLRAAYAASSTNHNIFNETTKKLQGGVGLYQAPGEGMRLPPFCPFIALSMCTTVAASFNFVHAINFATICSRLPLVESWLASMSSGQDARRSYAEVLHGTMKRVLACEFESYTIDEIQDEIHAPGPLLNLVLKWDRVKDGVYRIFNQEERDKVVGWWVELLLASEGPGCLICGHAPRSKENGMPTHFREAHWK